MTETTDYLCNHPKSHLQLWSNQLWLRPRVIDRPFSETRKFQNSLTLSWQGLAIVFLFFFCLFVCLFLYPACPLVWTLCILSVVEAWTVSCPKVSFARKKTSSKWSVFSAQHSLGNRLVLPGAIVSHVNRILSYLNAIFYSPLKCLKKFQTTYLKYISVHLENLTNMTTMFNYYR